MKNKYLSQEEKDFGLIEYMKHSTFNALGFSFLASTSVYLMAIYYKATNLQLGYVSAVFHMSGIILIFLPKLLDGFNLVQVHFYAWLFRGLICTFYGLLFWVSEHYAVQLILTVYTLFCLIRTIGVPVGQPIQQTLTNEDNIGDFVAKLSNRHQVMNIVSNAVSFLILSLRFLGTLPGLLLIQFLGIVSNTISSYYLKKVPCRELVEYKPGRNIFLLLKESLLNREKTMVLLLHWLSLVSVILASFFIPFFKKAILMPDNMIFLYVITGSFSTLLSGYLVKPFVDRIGSKPIMIMSSIGLMMLSTGWGFISVKMSWPTIFFLSFLTFFFQGMIIILTARLMLKMIPENDKITYTSMVHFFSAIVALTVGLFGGFLIDIGETLGSGYLHDYSLVFFMQAIVASGIGMSCLFLTDQGSLSVRETAQILLSTRNLKAYLDVYQFNRTQDSVKKKTILLSIGYSDTNIATAEIRKILKNPFSAEKREILRSLFERPREVLLDEIIREACDEHSYHQASAIFALGAYPHKKVEAKLLNLLDSPSLEISSTAAKSLARIGNVSSLEKIIGLANSPSNRIWEKMNFYIAFSLMDKSGKYLAGIFETASRVGGNSGTQTLLSMCSSLLDMSPLLSEIYRKENEKAMKGLRNLLTEARQIQLFNHHKKRIHEDFQNENWGDLFNWCSSLLEEKDFEDHRQYLKHAIIRQSQEDLNATTLIATLYFTYQLIKSAE
ncbi:MAG: MFS transporter [SAR324 cluster bacterium]|nr:MFS transporter [SAR324 cluster bacterium]